MRTSQAIADLSRVAQATARWMEHIHWCDAVVDPNEELAHILANLDDVRRIMEASK